MKVTRHILGALALASLLASFWFNRGGVAGRGELRISACLDLRSCRDGYALVSIEGRDEPLSAMTWGAVLPDSLVGLEDPRIVGGERRVRLQRLAQESQAPISSYGTPGGTLDEARTERLIYRVRPSIGVPPDGLNVECHVGYAGPEGCALDLDQVLMRPLGRSARVSIELLLPEGWGALGGQVDEIVTVAGGAPCGRVVIAGPSLGPGNAAHPSRGPDGVRRNWADFGLHLHGTASLDVEEHGRLHRLLEHTLRRWGPTSRPLDVCCLEAPGDGRPIELPNGAPMGLVHVGADHVGSWRRLMRSILPGWWGWDRMALELAAGPEAWWLSGLRDWESLRIPSRAGIVPRDPWSWTRHTWMWEPELATFDPTGALGAMDDAFVRRLAGCVRVGELDALADRQGIDLSSLVQPRPGAGMGWRLPSIRDTLGESSALATALVAATPIDRLPFEDDWGLELSPVPTPPTKGTPTRLAGILFWSDSEGYLEGCGCKQEQYGGVSQRAAWIAREREVDPRALRVDLGHGMPLEVGHPGLDPIVHADAALYLEATALAGVDAICLGPDDYRSEFDRTSAHMVGLNLPWLAAGFERAATAPTQRAFELGEVRAHIVAWNEILELAFVREGQERGLGSVEGSLDRGRLQDALGAPLPEGDLLIVAGRMSPDTLRELCKPGTPVDAILLAGFSGYPTLEGRSSGYIGSTFVALDTVGSYGGNHLRLGLDGDGRVVYADLESETFGAEAPRDAAVDALLDHHHATILDRLPADSMPAPLFEGEPAHAGAYVGASGCQGCHPEEHTQWRSTPHATAMQTLVAKRRDRHPKCVSCHVVGLGTDTGYDMTAPDPALAGVQCETCHGSGAAHAASGDPTLIRKTPTRGTCERCHDAEHSTHFPRRFEEAWSRVKHD